MKYVIELPEYIKHEVDIEEDVDKAEDFIKWYSATLTRAIKDSTPLQLQAEFDLDKMTDRVAEKALDEFTYNGKTLREWIELIVTADSILEIAEEKVINNLNSLKGNWGCDYHKNGVISDCISAAHNSFKEMKGENNE